MDRELCGFLIVINKEIFSKLVMWLYNFYIILIQQLVLLPRVTPTLTPTPTPTPTNKPRGKSYNNYFM